jgi:hypothetical protein
MAGAPSVAQLNSELASAITIACEQLLADYAIYRDHLDADGFANTFAEDGVLVLGSGTSRGRAAIRENITSRPSPGVAHMILLTSTRITPIDETRAVGFSYAIVLNGDRRQLRARARSADPRHGLASVNGRISGRVGVS